MLEKLQDPKTHEVIGRTAVNTLKLGIAAFLFIALQNAFYQSANDLIGSVNDGITALNSPE